MEKKRPRKHENMMEYPLACHYVQETTKKSALMDAVPVQNMSYSAL